MIGNTRESYKSKSILNTLESDENALEDFKMSMQVTEVELSEMSPNRTLDELRKGSKNSVEGVAFPEEIGDRNDQLRLMGRSKGVKALAEIASFPPLQTPHFNDDGSNEFRSII